MATGKKLKPGSFVYFGGYVHEVDASGKTHVRRDIGPDTKGKFKHRYYKGKKK